LHDGSGSDETYAKFTVAAAVFFLVLEVGYFAVSKTPSWAMPSLDAFGYAIGRDFLNTWMGGRAALADGPAVWFDLAAYNTALREFLGANFPDHFWSYPPHLLLFVWPLGLLPYLAAFAVWCGVGFALYLWAGWAGGVERRHLVFLAVAPAVAVNVFFGQNGFLTAALLIGGLANLDRRPVLAGILFGILTIKPQFGLLLPVMLVMTGRWRVIAVATATAAVLAAATSAWFGADVWAEYVRKVMPQQQWLLTSGGGLLVPMVSSAFVNARLAGLSLDVAFVVQAATSAAALALVIWTFRRRRDPVLSLALFVTATFLFSPWMLNYDMVVLAWVVALLRQRNDNTPADHRLALAVWTLPVTMLLAGVAHIPLALPVLAAFAGRLVWRLGREAPSAVPRGEPRMTGATHLAARP
jgi:hypothetical protein